MTTGCPDRPRVSVIIVNWNGLGHLDPCLRSLQNQTYRDFETVVVDNGSSDGSVGFLRANYGWVTIVPLDENRGFASGNNAGLAVARGQYIVTLNNDTVADPKWLEELVRVADSSEKVGMVSSRICSYSDPEIIDSVGVKICLDGMSRGAYRLRRFSSLRMDDIADILLPSACAALYKRSMIEQVGFFADDFFAYCEDTDLGLRGRWAGWEAVAATGAVVLHRYSQTGGTFSPLKLFLVERNHYLLVLRNFPMRLLLLLPFATLARFYHQYRAVISGKGAGRQFAGSTSPAALLWALAKGTLAPLSRLPALWLQRRRIMGARKIGSGEMVALLRQYRMDFEELLDTQRE